ncbi:MAG: hydrogenase nickel incorporation protein HypB [Candidatus Omnitrophica bacterium]|nr:hydrogenase nickel incorporation protein HypB [Candidatus Omnitrophota bacterium]
MKIKVMDKILAANDAWAEVNRKALKEKGIVMLNLIGSPGAGKTTLLEQTIDMLKKKKTMGVIEGDIATTKDAERIRKKGTAVYQINTGTACHLDAHLVNAAYNELARDKTIELVFVENIGNLVCPAEFDIGEDAKVALLSVTEGDDKIEKYPLLFTEAKVLVITKIGLLKYTNFNVSYVKKVFKKLNPFAPIVMVDSLTGDGLSTWVDFVLSLKK